MVPSRQSACAILLLLPVTFISAMSKPEEPYHLVAGDFEAVIVTDTRRLEALYGPRFDRSAVVTSVKLGGREFVEARGLCDEFGLNGLGVLGYAEAVPEGGEFIKIGVGALQRDTAGEYSFIRHWPVVENARVEVTVQPEALLVRQAGPSRHGYACQLEKQYAITAGGRLTIAYALTNIGGKPFHFEHYNHNFLAFSGAAVDPAYRLAPAFALPQAGNDKWELGEDGLRLRAPAPARGGAVFGVDLAAPAAENSVVVRHANGQQLAISGDFPVARFAVWATQAAVCPEIFHRARLAPGETVRWTRHYQFSFQP